MPVFFLCIFFSRIGGRLIQIVLGMRLGLAVLLNSCSHLFVLWLMWGILFLLKCDMPERHGSLATAKSAEQLDLNDNGLGTPAASKSV